MPEPLNVEAFIEAAPWRFAKSMPYIPHEYVVREKDVPAPVIIINRAAVDL